LETNSILKVCAKGVAGDPAAQLPTLVDVLRFWARRQPTQLAYTYVADGKERSLSYAELDGRASALAAELRARGLQGSTALLLYPSGLNFVEAFYACLYAGVIAVPVPLGRGRNGSSRLVGIVRDCEPKAVLTTTTYATSSIGQDVSCGSIRRLPLIPTDQFAEAGRPDGDGYDVTHTELGARSIAFLQYTSGSTAQPKGTVISHGNIMANQRMLRQVFGTSGSSIVVSWLPLFHDMGLVGNLLHAVYLGVHAALLSTLAVVRSPISWLRAIARYRGTFSGAPNFAYDLCVSTTTPALCANLDLSSWEVAFNGSEPVRHGTLQRFDEAFAPYGFRKSAFTPAYGLAEATLVVSGSGSRQASVFEADAQLLKEDKIARAAEPAAAHRLVGSGAFGWGDQVLKIVDPHALTCSAPAEVGEIWISGSHVAQGYFRNRSATAETFQAMLPGDERHYLRTGDLGFIHADELFVTGRIKDLIIVRGQKFYAQDIEVTVEASSNQIRRGSVAAFGVDLGEDQRARAKPGTDFGCEALVVVAELERRDAASVELSSHIARQVRAVHELPLYRVVLVGRNCIPKTTSGKLQRQQCRRDYLAGRYQVLGEWLDPSVEVASELRARIEAHAAQWVASRQKVDLGSVDVCVALAALGIDSITKVDLIRSVETLFATAVPEAAFHAVDSIRDLGAFVATCVLQPRPPDTAPTGPGAEGRASGATAGAALPMLVLPAFSALGWNARK
jgi:acyl-CoA synthetase (AMP-forming)/AMP-acid ligase II/acyl carrier protein